MAIGTATAIIGAAAIGAGTSLIAANKASSAARRAGNVQAQQFEQTRADLGPFREVGTAALFELAALQGLPVNFPGGPVIDQDGRPATGTFRGGSTIPAANDDTVLRIPRGEELTAVRPLRDRLTASGGNRVSRFRG